MEPDPKDPIVSILGKIAKVASTPLQKWTMAIFFIMMLGAVAAADAFAFENGAVATISQIWLEVNQKFWFATYVLVFLCGILVYHVAIPKDPGVLPEPGFWPQALLWTPFFWLGLWVASRWLWQLPYRD